MIPVSKNFSDSVSVLNERVGKQWIIGTPLGIGKPNPLINYLYAHAKTHKDLSLEIFTALSLEVPRGKSLLEKRFLQSFNHRYFGKYPELDYLSDLKQNSLPENIIVREFYIQSGKMLHSSTAQKNIVSSNYTHVARDMINRGVNIIVQMVAVKRSETGMQYSLSSNPDLTFDILRVAEREGRPRPVVIAMVNEFLPFMGGQAQVDEDFFDLIHDNSDDYFELFAAPADPISVSDYSIGLLASTLVKDEGTLQVGIGSLADAMVYSLVLRQQHNDIYNDFLDKSTISAKFASLIEKTGGKEKFVKGLYASSEMFVEGFVQLYKANILRRKVYPDAQLQGLLNTNEISEKVAPGLITTLLKCGVIDEVISAKTFYRLQKIGIFKADISFNKGHIYSSEGDIYSNDLLDKSNLALIEKNCLGDSLKQGAILHAAFYMGSKRFYKWLHDLSDEQQALFQMTPVSQVNALYGSEALDRAQRINARFINTCMKVDVLGAAASDTLDNHQVVSGVGGQYNFVAMAHALEGSRSILMLRSVHTSKNKVQSNVVWKYSNCTIPRHLRDIVITEYGIADLRGQSDEVCIQRMICIADSRFQENLREQAVRHQKLSPNWHVPREFQNNTPSALQQQFIQSKAEGYFPTFPFGNDFTANEKTIISALKYLDAKARSKPALFLTMLKAQLVRFTQEERPYLDMMKLDKSNTFTEALYAKLLVYAIRQQ
jgi:acyl-CoA hydrolase